MSRVRLPWPDDPAVSLIMPSYGMADMTIAALAAIAANTSPIFETFVVDDASPDGAADLIAEDVGGIDLLRSESNLGFGHAVNLAAGRSRGRYLCVMNNDIYPEPGWLEPMLARMTDPGVGAVVPMFRNPDGSVQEAGVAMGSDGFPWRWGGGLPPDAPEVAFPRTVDYGSGACMLVRRDSFREAGGFRAEYGLGYLEDSDLCMTLRMRGLRTVYEPKARVVHAVHGTFGAQSAHRLSEENRPRFLGRWAHLLFDRPPLRYGDLHPAFTVRARDALASHRVLLAAHHPGWIDLARELRHLLHDARLTALLFGDATTVDPSDLRSREVEVVPSSDPTRWLAQRRGHPDLVWVFDSEAMAALGPALSATQRQAAWIHGITTVPSSSIMPQADGEAGHPPTVLVAPPGHLESVGRRHPDARVLPADTTVPRLLAEAGILAARP